MTRGNHIKTRLDSLHDIDISLVDLLENFQIIYEKSANHNRGMINTGEASTNFMEGVHSIYEAVSSIAIRLRREVKILDENIGDPNLNEDGVMILPLRVEQKNIQLGHEKLYDEIRKL